MAPSAAFESVLSPSLFLLVCAMPAFQYEAPQPQHYSVRGCSAPLRAVLQSAARVSLPSFLF